MTRLIASILVWLAWKSGMAARMTRPMTMAIRGMTTTSSPDRATSVRRAMMTPPMMSSGAETSIVRPKKTTVWTCCTSLVLRVMSDAGPKWLTSTCENVSTLVKTAERTSRPKPMAMRAARYTAAMAVTPRAADTTSISPPVRRM